MRGATSRPVKLRSHTASSSGAGQMKLPGGPMKICCRPAAGWKPDFKTRSGNIYEFADNNSFLIRYLPWINTISGSKCTLIRKCQRFWGGTLVWSCAVLQILKQSRCCRISDGSCCLQQAELNSSQKTGSKRQQMAEPMEQDQRAFHSYSRKLKLLLRSVSKNICLKGAIYES